MSDSKVPAKTSKCQMCEDTFPDGNPVACIRKYSSCTTVPSDEWQFMWVCRECLASNWRYA